MKKIPFPTNFETRFINISLLAMQAPSSSKTTVSIGFLDPSSPHLTPPLPGGRFTMSLVNILMQWVIGSEGTPLAIDHNTHQAIILGVGHLKKIAPDQNANNNHEELNPDINYPVYIDEPLMVLSLSHLFKKSDLHTRNHWIANIISIAPNKSCHGYQLEEAMLLILMDQFGGMFKALGNIFQLASSSSLASRKFTLVSLKKANDIMLYTLVSWSKGSSDQFGFKARSLFSS